MRKKAPSQDRGASARFIEEEQASGATRTLGPCCGGCVVCDPPRPRPHSAAGRRQNGLVTCDSGRPRSRAAESRGQRPDFVCARRWGRAGDSVPARDPLVSAQLPLATPITPPAGVTVLCGNYRILPPLPFETVWSVLRRNATPALAGTKLPNTIGTNDLVAVFDLLGYRKSVEHAVPRRITEGGDLKALRPSSPTEQDCAHSVLDVRHNDQGIKAQMRSRSVLEHQPQET
jgi:hypothetical protein